MLTCSVNEIGITAIIIQTTINEPTSNQTGPILSQPKVVNSSYFSFMSATFVLENEQQIENQIFSYNFHNASDSEMETFSSGHILK